MKRTLSIIKVFLVLTALTTVFLACKDNNDSPKPTTAKIHGLITIVDTADLWSTWKDSGDVELTIFPEFSLDPPAGWGEVPDDFFGAGVPGGVFALGAPVNSQNPFILDYSSGTTVHQYQYEISNLDPGTYSALAVGFRHDRITDPSLKSATLGVYWGHEDEVSHGIVIKVDVGGGNIVTIFNDPPPSPITLEAGDDLEVNFKADFGFVKEWYH